MNAIPSNSARGPVPVTTAPERRERHSAVVRATHWVFATAFIGLVVSGVEILISHPRFYWGENGNVLTPAWLQLPIPSSRALVQTGYGFVLPDQNGWSRGLHFQAAWLAVITGLVYVVAGLLSGHFRQDLLPRRGDVSLRALWHSFVAHARFERPGPGEAWSYNLLQRLTYLVVIFGLFPMMIWTGLAMSPALTSAFPSTVTLLGGRQSARTLHFLFASSLVVFLVVHVGMVWFAGFGSRIRAMITGRIDEAVEGP
jgi:thiosulfate reductase cytochrome b subunit